MNDFNVGKVCPDTWYQGHEDGCQIRLPGCDYGPTIGSHVPKGVRFGKGMGKKGPDWAKVLCCHACHEHVDRRVRTLDIDFTTQAWHEGLLATLEIKRQEGYAAW